MLQFAGGIALGVDIGDLLQLESALERDRIALAAPQIEHVAGALEAVGQNLVGLLVSQHRGHMARDFGERLNELGLKRLVNNPPRLAGTNGEAAKRRYPA